MSFLNVLLLGGAAAFVAPLLIHLLNRSRFQSVDWGAMHLLEAAVQVNSRRVQWQSWLLLLLRCLIPVLLAICLARPVLTQLTSNAASAKKSVALLLDNSLSMSAGPPGDSAWDSALQHAGQLVDSRLAAEFSLWTTGGRPVDVLNGTTFDPERVHRGLQQTTANAGTCAITDSLLAGLAQLQRMPNPSKQMILLSDFQAAQWGGLSDAQLDALRGQLAAEQNPVDLWLLRPEEIRLSEFRNNLSVSIRPADPSLTLVNDAYTLEAHVENHGHRPVQNVRVVFSVDERELASRSVSIPAGAVQQIAFACEFTTQGWHHVALAVDDPQGIAGDNRAQQVVQVVQPFKIGIVDPDGGSELKHSSGYLQLALAPFQSPTSINTFDVVVDTAQQYSSQQLGELDVVILADVERLSDRMAEQLSAFVDQGGGLIIFAGPRLNADAYNAQWWDKQRILPLKFGVRRSSDSEPLQIAKQVIQSPLLNVFNSSQAGELSSLEFKQWTELSAATASDSSALSPSSPTGDGGAASTTGVLLALEGNLPLLASRPYGLGLVLQFATSPAEDDSNMPLRPAFVPLMQRIVAMATQAFQRRSDIAAGESITIAWDGPPPNPPPSLRIVGPDTVSATWEPTRQAAFLFEQTQLPGLYRVEDASGAPTQADGLKSPAAVAAYPQLFSVSCNPSESDLQLLSDEELENLAAQLGATRAHSAQEYQRLDNQRSQGQELWRWLLLALLAFLFAENLLGQKITKGGWA